MKTKVNKPDWRWNGDKELRLYGPGGQLEVVCRKQVLPRSEGGSSAWFLYDAAGSPILAGQDHDQHVYRITKRSAQTAAEQLALAGLEIWP